MCELGQVSRASFYRFDPDRKWLDADMLLRDEIQHIALEFAFYGRLRITAELKRRGWRRWDTGESPGSCERIICYASAAGSSWWQQPIPITVFASIPIWLEAWN
jgi:hypothetical protein